MLNLPLKPKRKELPSYLPKQKGIIEVPIDLLNDFLLNPSKALRDFASIPTEAISQFYFDAADVLDEVFLPAEYNLLDSAAWAVRRLQRLEEDNFRRYIHVDLSLNKDAAGISMSHIPGFVEVPSVLNEDGNPSYLPIIKFDFTGRLVARKGEEIQFDKIRDLIRQLRDVHLFDIALITFDRYQSADSVQILRNEGFVVGHLSIDRTAYVIKIDYDSKDYIKKISTDKNYATPHEMFRNAMVQRRVTLPYVYPRVNTELDEQREWSEKREILSQEYDSLKNTVSKSYHGSDDWIQGVVGSLCNAVINETDGAVWYEDVDIDRGSIDDNDDPYDIEDPYENYNLGDNIYGRDISKGR